MSVYAVWVSAMRPSLKLQVDLKSTRCYQGQMDPGEYTIGDLAARFGLATHVLRHWEDMGLLSPARRTAGRRVYGPPHVTRVAEILLGKDAGFSLEELRDLFDAEDRDQRREVLRAQLAQVRQRIARLTLSQKMLEHGLRCQHADYQSCPRFQEMVLARLDGVELEKAMDHD
jgi:DNA-binding transcriptional MerR regulator